MSNQRSPRIKALLRGLPHSVLLQNIAGDLFVILPATAKPFRTRTRVPGAAVTSRCTKYWKPVDSWRPIALDRRDPKWIRNLGPVRHYIYEIHESKTFLLSSTLSSALYLLLFRFAHHQYEAVCRLASSIVSDTVLSSEEAQLWSMLSNFADDVSPNAHASRLRLWLATRGCRSSARADRDVVLYLVNKFNNRFGYQLGGDPDDESITSERRWEKLKKQNADVIESLRVAIRAVKWKLRGVRFLCLSLVPLSLSLSLSPSLSLSLPLSCITSLAMKVLKSNTLTLEYRYRPASYESPSFTMVSSSHISSREHSSLI